MDNNITIIGIGRLGLCTALCFAQKYNVIGIDINEKYVDSLNNKTFNTLEPFVNELLINTTTFKASADLNEGLLHSDIIYILVDTPTSNNDDCYDVKNLNTVLRNINKEKVINKHIIIGCTVLPGYIANIGRQLLCDCINTTLSYNPEFIQQGSIINGFLNPDMVLIGSTNNIIINKLTQIYSNICHNKPTFNIMSPESAEICKISLNCFITTKISFANMIGDIADRTNNANKFDILKAIGTDSRIGNKCLLPGFGYGGPCFPRDNRALLSYANKINIDGKISRATDEYNNYHTYLQLNEYLKMDLDLYVFEDVAYKSNCLVPIIEESKKLEIAVKLALQNKKVMIKDKIHIINAVKDIYGTLFLYEIIN